MDKSFGDGWIRTMCVSILCIMRAIKPVKYTPDLFRITVSKYLEACDATSLFYLFICFSIERISSPSNRITTSLLDVTESRRILVRSTEAPLVVCHSIGEVQPWQSSSTAEKNSSIFPWLRIGYSFWWKVKCWKMKCQRASQISKGQRAVVPSTSSYVITVLTCFLTISGGLILICLFVSGYMKISFF